MPKQTKQLQFPNIGEMFRTMGESVKKQAITPNMHGYVPHDKQVAFHSAPARNRLYIGGNRSGKTTGGILEDLMWLTGKHEYRRIPEGGVRGRIVAVDFINGIEKIIWPEIKRWTPMSALRGGTWTDAYDSLERTLNFENGSFVEFMSYDQKLDKFAGTSRHFVHFDEEPPQDIFTECLLRLLDTEGSWWMTLTPVQGMLWMYDEIYMKGKMDPIGSDISVIEVETYENPYLKETEIKKLEVALKDEADARIRGKFIRRGGLVYSTFDPQIHIIDPIKDIPEHWEIYASGDHGFNNPTSWHWHGVDSDGNVVTFAEHYEREMVVQDHATRIKQINKIIGRDPGMYIGDPAMSQRNGITGSTVQSEYALHGIYINPANNEILSGINKINSYLQLNSAGKPRWTITRNCANAIWEIQRYRWKTWASKQTERENNKYDIPHKKDDHAMDDLRYFFTIMPDLTPVAPFEVKHEIPRLGSDGVLPDKHRFDEVLNGLAPVNTDWNIISTDQYMGGEW
jgi:phage terminase large subunit-like protein